MTAGNGWWFVRTSASVLLSPALLVLGFLLALQNAAQAEPYWLDLSSKATLSLIFLAPGFAALAAWDAARWRLLRTAAVRSWTSLLALELVIVATLTSTLFVVTLAMIVVRVGLPTTGRPRIELVLGAVLAVLAYASVGFLLGRFLPRLVASPAAFLGVWLWVAYTPAVQPFWLRNITGNIASSCCALDTQLADHALLAPVLVVSALLVASFAVTTFGRSRSVSSGAAALVIVGVVAASHLAAGFGPDPVVSRTTAQRCITAGGNSFCAWPEHHDRLRRAALVLARTADRLRAAGLVIPRRLQENTKAAGGWSFDLASPEPEVWSRVFARSPLDDLPPSCTDRTQGVWPAGVHADLAAAWLSAVSGQPPAEAADEQGVPLKRLATLMAEPASLQAAWFTGAVAAMRTCDPLR